MRKIFALFAALAVFMTIDAREMNSPQSQVVKTYKVGDFYDDGMKQGIVFQVSSDGTKGKIMSLKQSGLVRWSNLTEEDKRIIGADSATDGAYNMQKAMAVPDWKAKYPAFLWCTNLGEGWYLPAKQELMAIMKNRELLNEKLESKTYEPISYSWSSTEQNKRTKSGDYCAWVVNLDMSYGCSKHYRQQVRAVATFDTSEPVFLKGKVYKVGDLYDDGVKKGYVFEVDASGRRGKIISTIKADVEWAFFEEDRKIFFSADNHGDGSVNQAKIMSLPDWKDRFPAFEWCYNCGYGWYLPSIDELQVIMKNKNILALKLPYLAEATLLSSTESGRSSKDGLSYVYDLREVTSRLMLGTKKGIQRTVCAVTTFDSTRSVQQPVKKRYKLGDYYDDGQKEGIVFEVTEDGLHGKIICLGESPRMAWAYDVGELTRFAGADNPTDGARNMEKIMSVPDWENKYLAYKWCFDLGEGWYIPSKRELHRIFQNRCWIESKMKLSDRLTAYWSSTEGVEVEDDGVTYAWSYVMLTKKLHEKPKTSTAASVRAVAVF